MRVSSGVPGFDELVEGGLLILSDVTLCHIVTLSWLYSHG